MNLHEDVISSVAEAFPFNHKNSKDNHSQQLATHLQAIYDHTTEGLILLDRQGTLIAFNAKAMQNHKLTKNEQNLVIGKKLTDYIQGSRKQYFEGLIKQVLQDEVVEYDIDYDGSDGQKHWFHTTLSPVKEQGKITGICLVRTEITARKNAEEEKEMLIQELTQHNKNLKHFSYITSHNLRAPIANLLGLMQLVDTSTITDPLLLEVLDGFKVSTQLLNETINDLASVLVIKSNAPIPMENIFFSEMLEKVLGQIKNLLDEHKPEIRTNFSSVQSISFSSTYMESIFLNLLTNAIKYKSPTRKLQVDIDVQAVDADTVMLTFTDNGIGIDVERYKDKIFGLYQRFHNHPDSRGLGLYLIRSQLESLGGSIDIKSKVGEGTSFMLTFKR